METIVNNLELTCHEAAGGLVIDRVRTGEKHPVVPEEINGLPVVALGAKAFAPHADEGAPDHREIQSVTLPETLERVGDYAFYNCFGLERIILTDRTRYWGGSCLMNCRSLRQIDLTVYDEASPTLWYFADELMGELDVTLRYENGELARLIFPEYTEEFEDNKPAHFFDFHISGPGFPYHHAFNKRKLDMTIFDGCWEEMMGRGYEPDCAMRLAFFRLRYPRALGDRAAAGYREYLEQNCAMTLSWLLGERDGRDLSWYLSLFQPDKETLSAALERARLLRLPEAAALLLEELHRRFPVGRTKTFDL